MVSSPHLAADDVHSARRLPGVVRQVSRDALLYGTGQVLSRGLTVVLVVLLARWLPVHEVGHFSVLLALFGVAVVLTTGGLDRLAVREVARDPNEGWPLVRALVAIALVSATVGALGLAALVAVKTAGTTGIWLAAVLALSLVPASVAEVLDGALQGAGLMSWSALGLIVLSATWLLAVLTATMLGFGLDAMFAGLLLAHTLRFGVLTVAAARARVGRRFTGRWRPLLAEAAPYALSAAVGALQFRQDLLILAWTRGDVEAGLYSAAFRFVEAALFASMIGLVAATPAMARLHGQPSQLQAAYLAFVRIGVLAALPTATLLTLHAEPLLVLVFSAPYADAAPALRVLAWLMFVYVVHVPGMAVMLSGQMSRALVVSSVAATTLGLVLNLALTPFFGSVGAAVGSLGGLLAGTILVVGGIRARACPIPIVALARCCVWPAAGAAVIVTTEILGAPYLPTIVRIGIGLALYALVVLRDIRDRRHE